MRNVANERLLLPHDKLYQRMDEIRTQWQMLINSVVVGIQFLAVLLQ